MVFLFPRRKRKELKHIAYFTRDFKTCICYGDEKTREAITAKELCVLMINDIDFSKKLSASAVI